MNDFIGGVIAFLALAVPPFLLYFIYLQDQKKRKEKKRKVNCNIRLSSLNHVSLIYET